MNNFSNTLGGVGMIALALWWFYRYRTSNKVSSSEDLWRSSKVMSMVAIGMFLWISLLVWGLK